MSIVVVVEEEEEEAQQAPVSFSGSSKGSRAMLVALLEEIACFLVAPLLPEIGGDQVVPTTVAPAEDVEPAEAVIRIRWCQPWLRRRMSCPPSRTASRKTSR